MPKPKTDMRTILLAVIPALLLVIFTSQLLDT